MFNIPVESETAIVLAAKFTLVNGGLSIEFDPSPQLASSNMLIMLRDRCEEILVSRGHSLHIPRPHRLVDKTKVIDVTSES